jgi:hypothetical protein
VVILHTRIRWNPRPDFRLLSSRIEMDSGAFFITALLREISFILCYV